MIAEAAGGPWWVIVTASMPSVVSGVWVVWRWWLERSERRHDNAADREDRLARDVEAQRLALSREQAELFDRLRAELVRCGARLREAEQDRENGWDLARYWHRRSHALRHAGLNAQTIVAGLCAREEVPVPVWPDMTVVPLEEPLQ